MHQINLSNCNIRTDLIIEKDKTKEFKKTQKKINNILIEYTKNMNNNDKFTTINTGDVTDKDKRSIIENILVKELTSYINELNLKKDDLILIVGLGNIKSTPDSLGPETINNILVTSYLHKLNLLDKNYQNVAAISPGVFSTTGLETSNIVTSIIKEENVKALIAIDALCASNINRVNKVIQITNTGIYPGSGVGNNRKELSKNTLNIPTLAIGVPTVVDAKTICYNALENENIKIDQKLDTLDNLIVTPTEIDFQISALSDLLATSINKTLHDGYTSTIN